MRKLSVATALVTLCALSSPAHAQVDAERFKPAVTYGGWVTAEGSAVRPTQDPLELGLFLNYAKSPLVIVDDNDVVAELVSGRMGLDLMGSLTLVGPFAVGLDLPAYVLQSGDGDPSGAGLGDLRIVPKVRLLDDRESIGLAIAAEVRAPTHTGDFSGGDERGVGVMPKMILDHRFLDGFGFGINLGALFKRTDTFGNIQAGSELAYAAAVGYRFGGIEGNTELGVEFAGGVGLVESDAEETPLEAFLFLRHEPSEEWQLTGGPGVGVIPGYGVPLWRVFFGVRYRPTSHDQDGDGIPDDEDKCPNVAEDRDGYEDLDGCPEEDPDSDRDGVPDREDDCPDAKETINGVDDDDGCPDTGDPRVIYEDGQFKILDSVQFEHGKSEIKEDSHSLLDQVALMIKANPDVKVRVEGHTDDTGPRNVNMRLSEARAHSVRRYLITKGVNANRLSAKGYGPDKPLKDGTSDSARKANRRVEFVVE